ncbi:MAG: hypothetical protein GTO14_01690 [Anaerolineales bacterium]|nr:hypothetical protein [Anaerolineales bacterium]
MGKGAETDIMTVLATLWRLMQILAIGVGEGLRWLILRRPVAEHIYRAVVRLGPTFIKLGQVASTRPDLVPADISYRLRDLQENVPPFSFTQAREILREELQRPVNESFRRFPSEPAASASLAQVYFAELDDGTSVAVKVQRPGIAELIARDLTILRGLAWAVCRVSHLARDLRLIQAVDEFGRWTLKELDFEVEGHNAVEFSRNFADWPDILFPKVYWSHTTKKVLTMERLSGMRVDEVPQRVGQTSARRLAKRLAEVEMKMFISDAFFHADLHPGNIFFRPDGTIAVIDLGMVGRMTEAQRDRFLAYWIAITRRQRDRAFHHLLKMAVSTSEADLAGFRAAYDINLDRFYDADLSQRSLAQTYLEIVINGARFNVVFPPEMILQAKAVVTAEALDLVLAPDFRFADEVRPIVAKQLATRVTPAKLLDRIWNAAAEWLLLGEAVPSGPVPGEQQREEKDFRRAVKRALAETWSDQADKRLKKIQDDVNRFSTPRYWLAHPERQIALKAGIEILRLLALGIRRLEQEARLSLHRQGDGLVHSSDRGDTANGGNNLAHASWQAFLESVHGVPGPGSVVGEALAQALSHLREDTDRFVDPAFWEAHALAATELTSLISVLRLFLGHVEQAANASIQFSDNH